MLASTVSLGALRLQAQQRADVENSNAISTPEWNQYISQSYKELYDLLVAAYGNEYYIALPFQFNLTGAQFYTLPDGTIPSLGSNTNAPACYKVVGVDLQYSASPTGWVTMKRFEAIERNKYSYPNSAVNYLGYTNLKYRISGSNLWFMPTPASGQVAQLWYVPKPTSLQFMPSCSTTLNSTTVSMSDVSDLSVGMSVYGNAIPSGTVISSINTSNNTVVISSAATATQSYVTLSFWRDDTIIDGIAGWEEYVIVDAAIKAKIKQEEDVTDLRVQKAEMKARIEAMAEGRDIGQAHHVSDALSVNGFGMDDFGDGWGGGYGGY